MCTWPAASHALKTGDCSFKTFHVSHQPITLQQNRRRKKRPSYGIRTVEIVRARTGYGFTISGQAPCILSCIVNCSPAESAGLKPGDYLIAVNGQNVSKALHDDVVRLIGSSSELLKLQIAENYYSDSSDDEIVGIAARQKPKHLNGRTRQRQNHRHHVHRAEKVVKDMQTGMLFNQDQPRPNAVKEASASAIVGNYNRHDYKNITDAQLLSQAIRAGEMPPSFVNQRPLKERAQSPEMVGNLAKGGSSFGKYGIGKPIGTNFNFLNSPKIVGLSSSTGKENNCVNVEEVDDFLYPSLRQIQGNCWDAVLNCEESPPPLYQAIVGYLGTIEMPKELQMPGTRLQAVRNCIRRLRVEKKVHTLVLLAVHRDSVTLTNSHGVAIAQYPAKRITYSGIYASERKFFGLVTLQGGLGSSNDEGSQDEKWNANSSSSCHVFMVDTKMAATHASHAQRAKLFNIRCKTGEDGLVKCPEFPESADPILEAVTSLYRSRGGSPDSVALGFIVDANAQHQQHSNTSSNSNSSNSDSGIGFRDDFHHHQQQRHHHRHYHQHANGNRVFVVEVSDHQNLANAAGANCQSPTSFLDNGNRSDALMKLRQNSASVPPMRTTTPMVNEYGKGNGFADRLTVRAMPDPVGFQLDSGSPLTKNLASSERCSFHKYIPNRSLLIDSEAKRNGGVGKGQRDNFAVICAMAPQPSRPPSFPKRPSSYDELQLYKLSPKVYGVEYPSASGRGEKLARCSILPSHECSRASPDAWTETTENTGEQEGGSQVVHPPTQDEESDDSEMAKVEHGLEASKRWMRTSSLQRQFCKWRSSPHSNNESGALSDSEYTNGKLSSAGNSMLGLDGGRIGAGSTCSSELCGNGSVVGSQVGRVASWALSFERLLEDPAGVHTFAAFLKLEISYENIHFWVTCERFQKFTSTEQQMKSKAKEIFQRHLGSGAIEPVNVDSQARQIAQDGLEKPNKNLFVQAQRQIYNLMKFDCYSRFLKSSLYKESLLKEMSGSTLDYPGDDDLDPHMPFDHGEGEVKIEVKKASEEGNEESRWRSLLSWNRTRNVKKETLGIRPKNSEMRKSNRKKGKDKKNGEFTMGSAEGSGSRTSLANSDLAVMQLRTTSRESLSGTTDISNSNVQSDGLCRLILPDLSTAVVQTRCGESMLSVLQSLFERRELHYTTVDAYVDNSEKTQPLQLEDDSSIFGCREIRVEERILFQLSLPNKKSLVLKTPCVANTRDVLRPVLLRYGFKIDSVVLLTPHSDRVLDLNGPSRRLDGQNFVIQTKERYTEWGSDIITCRSFVAKRVDDQTTELFADLLSGKVQPDWDEFGVWDLDKYFAKQAEEDSKNSSELRSTGILGMARRNSIHLERDVSKGKPKGKFGTSGSRASVHESVNHRVAVTATPQQSSSNEKPVVSQSQAPTRFRKPSENEELYKVWERAQRSRLDDQRGTEINFELPDFLKPQPVVENRQDIVRKLPLEARASDPFPKAHLQQQQHQQHQLHPPRWTNIGGSAALVTNPSNKTTLKSSTSDPLPNDQLPKCSGPFVGESYIPTSQQAEDLFSSASAKNRVIEFGMCPPPRSPPHHVSRQSIGYVAPYHARTHNGEHTRSLPPLPPFWSTPVFQGSKSVAGGDAVTLDNLIQDSSTKGVPSSMDDSLTPSKIPPPTSDAAETSLHVEEADFPPPPPLFDTLNPPISPNDVPPPLPPKPKILPSRPPYTNRQLSSSSATAAAAHLKNSVMVVGGKSNSKSTCISPQPVPQLDLINHKGRSRRAMYIEREGNEHLNISFV